ncbi:HAMP domain-containing protein [Roseibium sediminicola]|uniref:HAMP domain-containing protein n=1 Tax=Roseibium sediminicola TaxID=2933272 RepID=A0ABT0GW33_9HYPH|nr:HAMP domain-containing protein [Roseibium sp. CAU 1639]MCK7613658.1 HAMP domain-containing protein [Roseibium sp. CAU 1639]
MAQAYIDGGPEAGNKMMSDFDAVTQKIGEDVEGMLEAKNKAVEAILTNLKEEVQAEHQVADMNTYFTIAFVILLAVAMAGNFVVLTRRVMRPLDKIVESIRQIGAGLYDQPIDFANRPDEVGEIGAALCAFQENGLKREQFERLENTNRERERLRQNHMETVLNDYRDVRSSLNFYT